MDDRTRQKRLDRIKPFLPALRRSEEVDIKNKQQLLILLQDLKDEGNMLFREQKYNESHNLYCYALYIARQLDLRFYHNVDKIFMATLFCNASLCSLRTDKFEKALENAEAALHFDEKNVKAIYRKTLALKELGRYKEALEQAQFGMTLDAKNFTELIQELTISVAKSKKGKSTTTTKSAAASSNTSKASANQSNSTNKSNGSQSMNNNKSSTNEWLQDTNAIITEKKENEVKKSKKKKNARTSPSAAPPEAAKVAAPADRNHNNNKVAVHPSTVRLDPVHPSPPPDMSPDTENSSSEADDAEFASMMNKIQQNKTAIPPSGKTLLISKVQASAKAPPQQNSVKTEVKSQPKTNSTNSSSMGLDDFRISAKSQPKHSSTQKQPVKQNLAKPPTNLEWPFLDKIDFCLACGTCFIKESEGVGGYKYRENLSHTCRRDVLLVRAKNHPAWLKVRPRNDPQGQPPVFKYKMCLQFTQKLPCRIGESNCSFAHNHIEINLWTKEKDQEFNISAFIREARNEGVYTSQIYEKKYGKNSSQPVAQPNIPGLHFAGKDGKKAAIPQTVAAPQKNQATEPPSSFPAKAAAAPVHQRPPAPVHQSFPYTGPAPTRHPSPPFASLNGPVPNFAQHPPPQSPPRKFQRPPGSSPSQYSIPNPFPNAFKLACPSCLTLNPEGAWKYTLSQPPGHSCGQFMLAFHTPEASKPNLWVRIRDRTSHRDFKGSYVLCHSVTHDRMSLCNRQEHCSFSHNTFEQHLWKLEQEGKFDIAAFIYQNRSSHMAMEISPGRSDLYFQVDMLLEKFGGYFRWICRPCFFSEYRISGVGPKNLCIAQLHSWGENRVISHVKKTVCTPVDERKMTADNAFYLRCNKMIYCQRWPLNDCFFAHSELERWVWMMERDTHISREELVKLSVEIHNRKGGSMPTTASSVIRSLFPEQKESGALEMTGGGEGGAPSVWSGSAAPPTVSQAVPPSVQPAYPPVSVLPVPNINLSQLCRTCWSNGQRCVEDADKDRCVKGHSNFKVNSVFIALPSGKEIRSLPNSLKGMKLVLCDFRPNCKRPICTHPHSEDEMDIWAWMIRNKVSHLAEVCQKYKDYQKSKTRKITEGESVVGVGSAVKVPERKSANQIIAPGDLFLNEHYCHYCGTSYNSLRQWDDHCMSEKHVNNVNSDREHQWNYRQPPWGQGNNLTLCAQHIYDKSCRYSFVPYMYNLCKYAHSEKELDEWRERHEWRQMKRVVAKERHMFGYTEGLLEEFYKKDTSVDVLTEQLPGVSVTCQQEAVIYKSEKNATFTWLFEVKTSDHKELERVALLYNKDRLHFLLKCPDGSHHQVAGGDLFLDVKQGAAVYKIQVHFTGGMFGSFSQWIVLDFGSRPVMVRKLAVEIGDQMEHEKVKELRDDLTADRWSSHNRHIIRVDRSNDSLTEELLLRYKEPTRSESVVTVDSMTELNQHNYVHKMHKLLELEEITRHAMISSYNLHTTVVFSTKIEEPGHFIIANFGDFFMKVTLSEFLTEDTLAGKLVLSSVSTVLFALSNSKSNKVYEAELLKDTNYNYDGRGKDYIYVVVSHSVVQALGLAPSTPVDIELQFQMDRKFFCRMHYALDCLVSTDVVFPDVMKFKPNMDQISNSKVKSDVLNEDQMTAVRHIVLAPDGYKPPFIMYGPFGTGKTETLAQATMAVLKNNTSARILICTQSNSAADLYITKHLGSFFKRQTHLKLLRLMAEERRVNTVPHDVLPFCHTLPTGVFSTPPRELLQQQNVVLVTVESSMQLTRLKLHGEFTHIFIDEAGQTLECETLMPLTLASTKTCVVLTGDHNQIGPLVYSQEARRQNFDVSVLVRLYNYYEGIANCGMSELNERSKQSPLNILLSINYRTKPEILRFISSVFYGGPENLKAYGKIPSVVHLTPLMFYAVQGKEVQNSDSTSYVNGAEAHEVIEQVTALVDNWPMEWGKVAPEQAAKQIAVIATYPDQVRFIRLKLRQVRGKKYLGQVNVSTIHAIQGQEFRAIFLSTVRSTHLLQEQHLVKALDSGQDIGDLGFLSNPKLINTALTRAQSFVAVVGDPVALCLIGECIQEWRTFLKHCSNMNSVRPMTYSYDFIRNQVIQIQMSPAGKIIDLITKRSTESFKQIIKKKKSQAAPSSSSLPVTVSPLPTIPPVQPPTAEPMPHNQQPSPAPQQSDGQSDTSSTSMKVSQSAASMGRQFSRDGMVHSSVVSCRDILVCLARESVKAGQSPRLEDIDISLMDGYAVLQVKQPGSGSPDFRVVSDSEDFVAFNAVKEKDGSVTTFENYGVDKMEEVLSARGGEYVRCVLNRCGERRFATVLPPLPGRVLPRGVEVGAEVEIPGSLHCGHAFTGDVVLVKRTENLVAGKKVDTGSVKGILKRKLEPDNRLFVCTADPDDCSVLCPVNSSLPPIYCLTTAQRLKLVRRRNLCVYNMQPGSGVAFSYYESVEKSVPPRQMFVVRYLTWLPGISLPLGIVVGVLEAGDDVDRGLKLLEAEYNISRTLGRAAQEESDCRFPPHFSLPTSLLEGRQDLTQVFCFSIGEEDSQQIEMAMSVTEVEDTYQIGLHMSDVVALVPRGSELERECAHRGASFTPLAQPHLTQPMLPRRLCEDVCSLLPGCDRLAVTVVITVDPEGNVLGLPDIYRSIINNKHYFSHKDVQEILLGGEEETRPEELGYLSSCLTVLYQLSYAWRYSRLGNGHFHHGLSQWEQLHQHSHLMMEEVKVKFSSVMAEVLLSTFEESTPLLVDRGPVKCKLDVWRRENAQHALNSISMARAFREDQDDQVCRCSKVCMCVFGYIRRNRLQGSESVAFLRESWNLITQALSEEVSDYEMAQDLISRADNKPMVCVAVGKLASIQEPEEFSSSHLVSAGDRRHYGLCVGPYTCLTQPLHRYMSTVVQRLLVAYSEGGASPYSPGEMESICWQATRTESQVSQFQQEVFELELTSALAEHPIMVHCVVSELDEERAVLMINGVNFHSKVILELSDLSPAKVTKVGSDAESPRVVLSWEKRVYSSFDLMNVRAPLGVVEVTTDRLIHNIPALPWQRLLGATRERNEEEMAAIVKEISTTLKNSVPEPHQTVMSGMRGGTRHYVPHSLPLYLGQPLTVQLCGEVSGGTVRPAVQLLQVTPQLDICLQLERNPAQCFVEKTSEVTVLPVSLDPHDSPLSMLRPRLPALAEECARAAVSEGERLTIQSVQIAWRQEKVKSLDKPLVVEERVLGEFILSQEFCDLSNFKPLVDLDLLLNPDLVRSDPHFSLDLVCVRYPHMENLDSDPRTPGPVGAVLEGGSGTWVGYCRVTDVSYFNQGYVVRLAVVGEAAARRMPKALLAENGIAIPCCVEWIRKTLQTRLMDLCMRSIHQASNFAQEVFTGRKPTNIIDPVPQDNSVLKSQLSPNQEFLLSLAFQQPLTCVVGGPGTGKSLCAARLAHLLVQRNRCADAMRQGGSRGRNSQLLICAESESSLDVVTGFLKVLNHSGVRVVRVYSEEIEERDFPTSLAIQPTEFVTPQHQAAVHEDIALHHLVRQPTNPDSQTLLELEMVLTMSSGSHSDYVNSFHQCMHRAQQFELSQAHVIICTCASTARSVLRESTLVRQVIVEDAAVIPEALTLVPLVCLPKVNQLVLLGDRPKETSLLGRYAHTAIRLTEQFRTTPALIEFPSLHFYKSTLSTPPSALNLPPAPSIPWPGEVGFPSLFCHLSGKEEVVSLRGSRVTEEDRICNLEEARLVAALVSSLRHHQVKETSIRVLCMTSAQADKVRGQVSQRGVEVSTVTEALGLESEYVIVSCVRSVPESELGQAHSVAWRRQHLGRLADPSLVSLALTRANAALFIVGDQNLLKLSADWSAVLDFYKSKESLQEEAYEFIESLESAVSQNNAMDSYTSASRLYSFRR